MMSGMVINYGLDILRVTYDALKASGLSAYLSADKDVLIKPNLVLARPPGEGATTHAEVVEAVIIYLNEQGIKKFIIAESAWAGGNTKQAFEVCGYNKLAAKYNIPLVDLKEDKTAVADADGFKLNICREALKPYFLINIPVLKAHCQTKLTCNLKNLKGLIPDSEKRRFHTLGLHKPIALLNKVIKTGFCVVDGICGDLNFEEGGNPIERNMIIAGQDPVTIDSYCANLLGYDVSDIDYIMYANQMKIGALYDKDTPVTVLNADKKPKAAPPGGIAARYSAYIEEREACSVCYSALICALHKNNIKPAERIKIGQGYKGQKGVGVGVGECASGIDSHIGGCPPKANEIANFLKGVNYK